MGYPQGIISYEIYSVEIDYAAQQTEHHEINKPELHNQPEKGNSCLTEISNYRVNGKKHCHKGERKKYFRFSEVVHGRGITLQKSNIRYYDKHDSLESRKEFLVRESSR